MVSNYYFLTGNSILVDKKITKYCPGFVENKRDIYTEMTKMFINICYLAKIIDLINMNISDRTFNSRKINT